MIVNNSVIEHLLKVDGDTATWDGQADRWLQELGRQIPLVAAALRLAEVNGFAVLSTESAEAAALLAFDKVWPMGAGGYARWIVICCPDADRGLAQRLARPKVRCHRTPTHTIFTCLENDVAFKDKDPSRTRAGHGFPGTTGTSRGRRDWRINER